MRDRFVHHLADPTGITEWLAGKGAGAGNPVAYLTPTPIVVPREPERAPEPPPRILSAAAEWANLSPVPEETNKPAPVSKPKAPKAERPTHCLECKNPLPTMRSANARYCSRGCKSVADHRKERMVPYDAESHRMLRMPT